MRGGLAGCLRIRRGLPSRLLRDGRRRLLWCGLRGLLPRRMRLKRLLHRWLPRRLWLHHRRGLGRSRVRRLSAYTTKPRVGWQL